MTQVSSCASFNGPSGDPLKGTPFFTLLMALFKGTILRGYNIYIYIYVIIIIIIIIIIVRIIIIIIIEYNII